MKISNNCLLSLIGWQSLSRRRDNNLKLTMHKIMNNHLFIKSKQEWKTNNTKLTKADYLRQVIEDLLRQDKDYQKFIAERSE